MVEAACVVAFLFVRCLCLYSLGRTFGLHVHFFSLILSLSHLVYAIGVPVAFFCRHSTNKDIMRRENTFQPYIQQIGAGSIYRVACRHTEMDKMPIRIFKSIGNITNYLYRNICLGLPDSSLLVVFLSFSRVFLTHPPGDSVNVSMCVCAFMTDQQSCCSTSLTTCSTASRQIYIVNSATKRSILTRRRNKFTLWPTDEQKRKKNDKEKETLFKFILFILYYLFYISLDSYCLR